VSCRLFAAFARSLEGAEFMRYPGQGRAIALHLPVWAAAAVFAANWAGRLDISLSPRLSISGTAATVAST
jgi:hypothetical protein